MQLEQSGLWREIQSILTGGPNPVHFSWEAVIHVNTTSTDYTALKVIEIDMNEDYYSKYSDETVITVLLPAGQYAGYIYPHQGNLDITLTKRPLTEIGDQIDSSATIPSERYTATLSDNGNPILEGTGSNTVSIQDLDLTNLVEIKFQLVNKSLEQLRMASVGGIFRGTTVGDIVKGIMTTESQAAKVDGGRLLKGVEMVPSNNTSVRDHVIIPQGTPLVDVPNHVHVKCGGIYTAGLGYFLKNDYWYLYPAFNTDRFDSAQDTLTIIMVPPNRFPSIERTYRQNGNNLIVLGTGDRMFRDNSDANQLNGGNGVRYADASKFMEGFTQTKNNITVASRGDSNSEFVTVPRSNGNNNIRMSPNRITSNPSLEMAKQAMRNGGLYSVVWENSDSDLLQPGMPVQFMYLANDQIVELYGTLLKAQTYIQMDRPGLTSMRHISRTALTVFAQGKSYSNQTTA